MDFLIIGATKCATTWLQLSLSANPDVFMPAPELHYFSREYHRGSAWFQEQFSGADNASFVGEKSNSYLTDPEAAERIARDLPDVKLITQLRDPVQRTYSEYCMLFRRGEVTRDIRQYLDPANATAGDRFLDQSRYAHHLQKYRNLFGDHRILVLDFDRIRDAPEAQAQRVAEYIGLGGDLAPPVKDRVKDKTLPVVPLGIRRVLAPVRRVLDPVRDTWPVQQLRNAIARPVNYPPLPADLEAEMAEYFRTDLEALRRFAPHVGKRWPACRSL
ncbi:sulfotransferase family protein [Aliiruegeria lutimaris]|uniref:sulfotransferase family protein n=1 Tax=Aliiruegeria lutimaris TaxID=571298 RepID=UPI00147C38C3|nr:sulfotransferase [Aliiruegeria lutimaris]